MDKFKIKIMNYFLFQIFRQLIITSQIIQLTTDFSFLKAVFFKTSGSDMEPIQFHRSFVRFTFKIKHVST
jgi:hypothetical protein